MILFFVGISLFIVGIGLCLLSDKCNLDSGWTIFGCIITFAGFALWFAMFMSHITRDTDYNEAVLITETHQCLVDNLDTYKDYPELYIEIINNANEWNKKIKGNAANSEDPWINWAYEDWWTEVPYVNIEIK